MNVDWKYFSQTTGYKSLKDAYMRDARKAGTETRPMRNKDEFYKKFQWVINRCIHYSQALNKTPWEVLDAWESKRDYWWMNFYQDSNQPKIRKESISKKPRNVRGIKKYYKRGHGWSESNNLINNRISDFLKRERTRKARWSVDRKKRQSIKKNL